MPKNTRDYGKGTRSFEFGGGVTNDASATLEAMASEGPQAQDPAVSELDNIMARRAGGAKRGKEATAYGIDKLPAKRKALNEWFDHPGMGEARYARAEPGEDI